MLKSKKREIILFSVLIILIAVFFLSINYSNAKESDYTGKAIYDTLSTEQKQAYWDCFKTNKCSELLAAKKNKEYRACSLSCNKQAKTATENIWCEDSDKGDNFLEKGIVKTNIYPNGKEDSCYTFPNGKTYLFEGRCKNNKHQYLQKNCGEVGEGFVCDDGVCVEKINEKEVNEDYVVAVLEDSSFMGVAEYFAQKKNSDLVTYSSPSDLVLKLQKKMQEHPVRYLALVNSPEELTPDFMHEIDRKLRNVDEDFFLDVAYGFITSFNQQDALAYVERIATYQTPAEPKVYNPNPDYKVKTLSGYGIETVFGCLSIYTGHLGIPCSKEEEHVMDKVIEYSNQNNILWFNVHGDSNQLYFSNGEKIVGSPGGVIGKSFVSLGVKCWCGDGMYIGEFISPDQSIPSEAKMICEQKAGTTIGISCQGTTIFKDNSIKTSATLVVADSCLTARINGSPTFSNLEEEEIMSKAIGIIEESPVLGFLKSGGYSYLGTTVPALNTFFATQEIINDAILNSEPIGIAIKRFKNRNLLSKELIDENESFSKLYSEIQITSWFLFGDPSMIISNKHLKPVDCIQEISKQVSDSQEKYTIKIFFDGKKLNENFALISKIEKVAPTEFNIYSSEACLITLLDIADKKVLIQGLEIPPGWNSLDTNNVWKTGDEVLILVPKYKTDKEIIFTVEIQ